jgi:hypothetical protein
MSKNKFMRAGKVEKKVAFDGFEKTKNRLGDTRPEFQVRNFEELYADRPVFQEHWKKLQTAIESELVLGAREYTGALLDGLMWGHEEKLMLEGLRLPLLVKDMRMNPEIEMGHILKQVSGDGKTTHKTSRTICMKTHLNDAHYKFFADAREDLSRDFGYYVNDRSVEGAKSGSIQAELQRWIGGCDPTTLNGFTMGATSRALARGSDYKHLFMKAWMNLKILSLHYSTKGSALKQFPVECDVRRTSRLGMVGLCSHSRVVICADDLTPREMQVLAISAMPFPSLASTLGDETSIYNTVEMLADDVRFVVTGRRDAEVQHRLQTPEQWWKSMCTVAGKLGCVSDMVAAYRAVRGLAHMAALYTDMCKRDLECTLDVPLSFGCQQVFAGSRLHQADVVLKPTNLVCGLGDIVADAMAGQEAFNMVVWVIDEIGGANSQMHKRRVDASKLGSVDSILRESKLATVGNENTFFKMVADRLRTGMALQPDNWIHTLFVRCAADICTAQETGKKVLLTELYNLAPTVYYGPCWDCNVTAAIDTEQKVGADTWGGLSREPAKVLAFRSWCDVYGISDQPLLGNGFNATQRKGLATQRRAGLNLPLVHGVYKETYRDLTISGHYEPRLGCETVEKDRVGMIKTYLSSGGYERMGDKVLPGGVEPVDLPEVREVDPLAGYKGSIRGKEGPKFDEGGPKPVRAFSDDADSKLPSRGGGGHTPSFIGTTFGSGVRGYLSKMGTKEGTIRAGDVPADGHCIAHAFASGLRNMGVDVDVPAISDFLADELREDNWWRTDEAGAALADLGYGVAIVDLDAGNVRGYRTGDRSADDIVGMVIHNHHAYYVDANGAAEFDIPLSVMEGDEDVRLSDFFPSF